MRAVGCWGSFQLALLPSAQGKVWDAAHTNVAPRPKCLTARVLLPAAARHWRWWTASRMPSPAGWRASARSWRGRRPSWRASPSPAMSWRRCGLHGWPYKFASIRDCPRDVVGDAACNNIVRTAALQQTCCRPCGRWLRALLASRTRSPPWRPSATPCELVSLARDKGNVHPLGHVRLVQAGRAAPGLVHATFWVLSNLMLVVRLSCWKLTAPTTNQLPFASCRDGHADHPFSHQPCQAAGRQATLSTRTPVCSGGGPNILHTPARLSAGSARPEGWLQCSCQALQAEPHQAAQRAPAHLSHHP